jgi:hypothetical protein
MPKQHRYHQQALGVPGAKPRDYSPPQLELAGPKQGWLALDGGALGPLFNDHTTTTAKPMPTTATHRTAILSDYLQRLAHDACQKAISAEWSSSHHGSAERQHLQDCAHGRAHLHCFERPSTYGNRPTVAAVSPASAVVAWALENWGNWILQGRPATWSTEASDALKTAAAIKRGQFFIL